MSVGTDREGDVQIVTLDRPERRNAVDGPTADVLADAFRAFDADDSLKVAVLTGGGGTFCAGADLKALADPARRNHLHPDMRADGPMGPTRMDLGKPVIAAIEGHAVAGGLELACWCDLRVAATDSVLGVFCRRWGVPLIDGGTVRLPRLVGMGRALDLILTGREVLADEAYRIGLVDRLCVPGSARQVAIELAHQIASFPHVCMRADRASTLSAFDGDLAQALEREFRGGVDALHRGGLDGAQRFADGAGRGGSWTP
jgi:enoyl-CoA hydratase